MGQSSAFNTGIPQYNPNLNSDPFGGESGIKFSTNNIGSEGFNGFQPVSGFQPTFNGGFGNGDDDDLDDEERERVM